MTQVVHITNRQVDKPSLASVINGDILRRALLITLVMGSALTLANQSASIFGNEAFEYLRMALAYLTPFVVVTISQGLGVRQAIADARRQETRSTGEVALFSTAISHGIPARAVLVGLIVGSLNSAIIGGVAFLQHGSLDTVPLVVLGQAFSLPILIGALSQAIAYRRAVSASGLTRALQATPRPQFAQ